MTTATKSGADQHQRRYLNRKQRDLNLHRGIPNRVDATQARAHIAELRKTMGWVHIAKATGCGACYLRDLTAGRFPVINRATQQKILAVQPTPAPDPGFYVDATGTVRRVRALMARGHSQYAIAAAAETTQHRISIISNGVPRVRQKIADRIAAAYQQLADHDGTSKRALYIARQGGWRDPAYWIDVDRIDDPDFDPEAAEQPSTRAQQIAEDGRWLLASGLDRDQAAERLSISRFYLDRALREHPEPTETTTERSAA